MTGLTHIGRQWVVAGLAGCRQAIMTTDTSPGKFVMIQRRNVIRP